MFVFPITLGCFQSRSAVPNSLNCQTRLPSIIALLPFPSLPFLAVIVQWAMPTMTFSIVALLDCFHHSPQPSRSSNKMWGFCLFVRLVMEKFSHLWKLKVMLTIAKMSTKLSWKRYNARNVAVNWSELVCSPPRRQPLSIRPRQGSETNTQIQIQRHK